VLHLPYPLLQTPISCPLDLLQFIDVLLPLRGPQKQTQCCRYSLTNVQQRGTITSFELLATVMQFALYSANSLLGLCICLQRAVSESIPKQIYFHVMIGLYVFSMKYLR